MDNDEKLARYDELVNMVNQLHKNFINEMINKFATIDEHLMETKSNHLRIGPPIPGISIDARNWIDTILITDPTFISSMATRYNFKRGAMGYSLIASSISFVDGTSKMVAIPSINVICSYSLEQINDGEYKTVPVPVDQIPEIAPIWNRLVNPVLDYIKKYNL